MEWDWEKHDIFSSKKLKSSEYIDRSFNLSGVVKVDSNSSIESSLKGGMEELSFSSEVSRSFHKPYSYMNGSSPSLEASVCSSDQSVGLKLGKRTSSSLKVKISCVPDVKKAKLLHQSTAVVRCQVEGCNLDLSSAKEYYKKHQVCENHSKSSKVVLGGVERRFCQQCSRFHGLSEFDGKKRSCRQRLSDHNARRRKPQKEKETVHFNSRSQSSSFYDGQHQISFVSNNVPELVQPEPALNSIWETTRNSQHTAGVFHQAYRALSLLSNNSWGSCESDFSALDQPMHANGTTMAQHGMHSAHHNLSPENWQVDPHIQESHILKEPYGYY
ncbi:putative transcription factor SBP family [Helianthus annuus]|uniref:Transcription factor SBP family n=2 Tax=Helianthus annuus TaxID=4232 RepID=A0A9K3IRV2_HELAN|nr:squamosa promoter-binding-like protein 2 isoform X2 [Helianthus annuus]KAF5801939.1 putative transcription factor SBP family [Helianthus annuus]KAJ0560169.1 putative transcription factor SBP family [Helianthus annuus]KAJ0566415.1 putative transcription factor SBP family [Helianthus annuus]KAJ0573171.1 putative transcription factor SBP family [Helianthus annuus]KAJ0737592.1 putative transcription factor SBP family [Helianthus annuus]